MLVSWPDGDTSLWVVRVEGDGGDLVKKVAAGENVVSELPTLGAEGIRGERRSRTADPAPPSGRPPSSSGPTAT